MTRSAGARPNARRVFRARAVLFIERLAPALTLAAGPIALILIISLFDLWGATPRWAHALALIAALALAARFAWRVRPSKFSPTRDEALARLERDGAVRHDALRALEDSPSAGANPLWDAHLIDSAARAKTARLAPPALTANGVDRFGLRYATLALLAVATIAAGKDAGPRIALGFIPGDPRAAATGFADLWIEPPAYTGKAPIYLLRARDALPGLRDQIDAPEGSIVHAQINAKARARLSLRTVAATINGAREVSGNSGRMTLTLQKTGVLSLSAGGRTGRWPIGVIDDRAPVVSFAETPAADRDGRFAFSLRIDDDYGATSAALRLRLDPDQPRPLDAPEFGADAKSESRLIPLDGVAGATGLREFAIDLAADPWAGLNVIVAVIVTDAAGQTGETDAIAATLPAKEFFNPLARSVIEQRQTLAVAPEEWRRAEWAFSGLTLGPEYFFEKPTDYLLLRTAMWRVSKEPGGDFKDTVDEFWPLALQLEDEALELARRRLDAAKDALREALENGAADDEINRLTEELRAALQQYLQALAQSGEPMENGPPPDETLSDGDLQSMIDSIRDLARSGAEDAARQALDDLENLLNNLRPMRRAGDGGGEANGPGGPSGPTGEAGDLIGRQRELADKSFARSQTRNATGDDLAEEESALAGDLSELMRSLDGREGADPDGAAGRALGRALSEMRRAEGALREEDFDGAASAMERAIASLREGAENLARAGGAQRQVGGGGSGVRPMRDPLGRTIGEAYGEGVEVPEKSDAQRTRELIEELRRRLSDGERTEEEIDYLERLLKRF